MDFRASLLCFGLLLAACGGDQGQEQRVLRAGAAAVVVTPVVETFEDLDGDEQHDEDEPFDDLDDDGKWDPVYMGGFGAHRPALGIQDDLYSRVLVLDKGDIRVGIVSIDWVGLFHDHALEFEQAAAEAGLDLDLLLVSCTHNHEGPDTMGIWGEPENMVSGLDEEYVSLARQRTVAALAEAVESLTPVRVSAAVTNTENLTVDSRKPYVKNEKVTALRFESTEDSTPVAVIVHWSNHPEAMEGRNRMITPDFPLGVVAALEAAHPQAVGIFWQGTVGGLLHPMGFDVLDANGELLDDPSFERTERIGQLVAEAALEALSAGQDITADGRLVFHRRKYHARMDNLELKLAAVAGIVRRTVYDEQGNVRDLEEVFNFDPYIETQVSAIDIGELQIVTVPGELYPELAMEGPAGEWYYEDPQDPGADFYPLECEPPVYSLMRDTPYRVVLGLTNDEVGYIIPRCQFDSQPPFAYGRDDPQYGEEVSPGPEFAPQMIEALAAELQALGTMD